MKVRSTVWMSIARRAHFSLWRVQSRSWSSWRRERRWLSSLRTWCCRSTLSGLREEHRNLWRYNKIIKMDVMPFADDNDTVMQFISFKYVFNFSLVGGNLCSFPSSSWQVKLSSKSGQNIDIVWTENGLLITATGEHVVRSVCWRHLLKLKFSAELLYLSFAPFYLDCGTWNETTIMFYLWMRLWGLRKERWSTACHTVQQKVIFCLLQ